MMLSILLLILTIALPIGGDETGPLGTFSCKSYSVLFLGQNTPIRRSSFGPVRYSKPILANLGDVHCMLKRDPVFSRILLSSFGRISQLTKLRVGIDAADIGRFDPIPDADTAGALKPSNETYGILPPRGSRRSVVCQNTLAQARAACPLFAKFKSALSRTHNGP